MRTQADPVSSLLSHLAPHLPFGFRTSAFLRISAFGLRTSADDLFSTLPPPQPRPPPHPRSFHHDDAGHRRRHRLGHLPQARRHGRASRFARTAAGHLGAGGGAHAVRRAHQRRNRQHDPRDRRPVRLFRAHVRALLRLPLRLGHLRHHAMRLDRRRHLRLRRIRHAIRPAARVPGGRLRRGPFTCPSWATLRRSRRSAPRDWPPR